MIALSSAGAAQAQTTPNPLFAPRPFGYVKILPDSTPEGAPAAPGAAPTAPAQRPPQSPKELEAALAEARRLATAEPSAEYPARLIVDILTRLGRGQEAVAEADKFASRVPPGALLRAQRGFLRRELNDLPGAVEDFSAALATNELAPEQRSNLEAALNETQIAATQSEADRALARRDYARAIELARSLLQRKPDLNAARLTLINALSGSGRKDEALAEADRLVTLETGNPVVRSQRGFLRRELGDLPGAMEDFSAALSLAGLSDEQRRNLETAIVEVKAATLQAKVDQAETALNAKKYSDALALATAVLDQDPDSEVAARIRVEALSRSRRRADAMAEADKFLAKHDGSALIYAQRGFLRRGNGHVRGAIDDFSAALKHEGLSTEQRRSVEKALAEAQGSGRPTELQRAQTALNSGDYYRAGSIAEQYLRREPNSESGVRILIEALTRAGRNEEALAACNKLVARGYRSSWLFVRRGFLLRYSGDIPGAAQDFNTALQFNDLDPATRANVRYAATEAMAALAEKEGRIDDSIDIYKSFAMSEQSNSSAWYSYGYALLKRNRKPEAGDALRRGLEISPASRAYLDAANAYVLTNAPLASQYYRQGLDRMYARDPAFADLTPADRDRIRNEVVKADASIQTSIGYGGIGARPEAAGGHNDTFAAEMRVRFDGRYLASIPGLEFVARGYIGRDSIGTKENELGAGLRFRPFPDLDLYGGVIADHFFAPNERTQAVVIWGLGLGSDPYPYQVGWMPYWDFGAFGAYRTLDRQVLQDVRANVGFMYENYYPLRMAIGPTLLAVIGYDSLASTPWSAGIGPSILSRMYLGGDRYRSYDAILSLQVGYLTNVGSDARQRGWRGQVGITF